ncbi:hyaluronoglucosaminidase [Streptomyces phyllanthi]|uniref:Hyaluronoglucosaminidase n=1 Tax=Streptomyces phyllanthi TaxID=1803180 RepID=A0A5N8WHI7_9ACTN|nr:hyaluronoglucosaminidase [Streptomyces phyllanthi]MPY45954.1 hyaluronoglucosaminidase [Streptomyces phyllanthi]
MPLARRLFLGGFTAGAVTVAVGGTADTAEADDTVDTFPGTVTAEKFSTNSTVNSAFFKTTSTTEHTATLYQAGTSGAGVALNVISDNPDTSAMYLSGTETGRGTLKITHRGYADASDKSAAALSIDLRTAGTAAQGIYVTATDGPTTGSLIALRNNDGLDDFVVKGTGRIGVGIDRGATPRAQVHVVQSPSAPAALLVEGSVRIGNAATVPTSVDGTAGGGALYASNGRLVWRGSAGTVTVIAPA